MFVSFCNIPKLLTYSHDGNKDVLDIFKTSQVHQAEPFLEIIFIVKIIWYVISIGQSKDKDREKHVAKPQRALTAPNGTADEG